MNPVRVWHPGALAALCIALAACNEPGTGPDVSDTEIWRLELEQTDDGSTVGDIAVRRGTIHLTLRLNHTTQPDPSCADAAQLNVTTFVASVEVLPSRLQTATTGSADGSWNCFGFVGEVRLDDGTTYALSSPSFAFDPAAPISLSTGMIDNIWTAGARRGHFLMAPAERFEYEPFDTHLDAQVLNQFDEDVEISFIRVDSMYGWRHHDLEYEYDRFPLLDRAVPVPAGETRVATFPAQPFPGTPGGGSAPFSYGIWVRFQRPFGSDSYGFHCLMGPERQWQVELIVHEPGHLECSTGWLGSIALFTDPRRLFMRPGEAVTIPFSSYDVLRVEVESREPTIVPRIVSFTRDEGNVGRGQLEVAVGESAPRREHSVVLTGHAIDFEPEEVVEILPVEVYDLATDVAPDTVRVPVGESTTATVRLDRDGLVGLDVELGIDALPDAGFLVPPTFSPAVTQRDSSALTIRIDPTASTGLYPMSVCARIVGDPRERCHEGAFVLAVTEALPPFDLALSTSVSSDTVAVGVDVYFDVLVSLLDGTASTGVVASGRLPDGFTYRSHEATIGSYAPGPGTWTIGTVEADRAALLRIHARADDPGEHPFSATLSAGIDRDSNAANNSDTVRVTVLQGGFDLEVTKAVDRDSVEAGDTVQFTLTAMNHGPGIAVGVAVRDQLPAGLTYVSDDGAGAYSSATGTWSVGFLPAGDTRTLRIRAVATATATNEATILSETGPDANPANNRAEVRVGVGS